MRVADYIAKYLKGLGVRDVFMLTGYGAMYLNDAIKLSGIKYYATRNEATAPIMAESYARIKKKIGVVCVTAGPGSTNAIPGLAEAYVDSAPIIILSGQVDYKHTTYSTKSRHIRTFGTAEINIVPIVESITKYAQIITNPKDTRYILEKAIYLATSKRPGPVWIDIPLDVQKSEIDPNKLKSFKIKKQKKNSLKSNNNINKIIKFIEKSSKPLIVVGNGIRQSNMEISLKKIIYKMKVPVIFSRFAQDLFSHNEKYIFGHGGIKGSKHCRKIMNSCDLVLSFGCRFAPQFVGHDFSAFKNAKVIAVDIEKDELKKKGQKIDLAINEDLIFFLPKFLNQINKIKLPNYNNWVSYCYRLKKENPIIKNKIRQNPIDLYYFMQKLGEVANKKDILITDAGSNYYIGGQVWKFTKQQKEIASVSNAAMGLSVPLAIGAAVAAPKANILAVTGDGSLELNIQELKTISHNKFNIKLFVINNGGYVSMHNWADSLFKGRRLDTAKDTGDGTLNFKNIAKAFDLNHYLIKDVNRIEKDLKKILNDKKPLFIEVITDPHQKIIDAFKDY